MVRLILTFMLLICSSTYAIKFIVYGDTRDGLKVNAVQAKQMNKENPALVINVGDVWGSTSQANWRTTLITQPTINTLLTTNNFLVSRGNHETFAQLSSFKPSLLRGNVEKYSFTQGNCFFICMGMAPNSDYKWLREQLASEASKAATWRFIYHHYPIYSSFGMYADGVTFSGPLTQYRNLCDTFNVTASFYGHAHGYLRTKVINNGLPVSVSSSVDLSSTLGTVYILSGGGGAPLDGVSKPAWWTSYQNNNKFFITIIEAGTDTCTFTSKDTSGAVFDQLQMFYEKVEVKLNKENGPVLADIPEVHYQSSVLYVTNSFTDKSKIDIFGINGRVFYSSFIQPGKYSLSNNFRSGIYLCRIVSGSKKFTGRFIVK